jgi:hypothetical protein
VRLVSGIEHHLAAGENGLGLPITPAPPLSNRPESERHHRAGPSRHEVRAASLVSVNSSTPTFGLAAHLSGRKHLVSAPDFLISNRVIWFGSIVAS